MSESPFIACGMYALTPELRSAWRDLLARFYPLSGLPGDLPEVRYDTDESSLRDPGLVFGYTCGYPLVTRLADRLEPLCVPEFDVPGCQNHLYSSRFIVPADSDIGCLADCRGLVLAVNSPDSNSGMNVLRHALAKLGAQAPWFAQVEFTGSHRASLEAVAAGRAQLAAIDCVSYQLIMDFAPHLADAVRTVEFSRRSAGLPLVAPRNAASRIDRDDFALALNQALGTMPAGQRRRLHIRRFLPIELDAYASIGELERQAVHAGYPELK